MILGTTKITIFKYMLSSFNHNSITVVKTPDAVDQDRHGINGMGLGQLDTAKEAICNMTKVI